MTGTEEAKGLHPAATACVEYSGGGKNDWFLPSPDELVKLYSNKNLIGGFVSEEYWSSSQYTADNKAYTYSFNIGAEHVYSRVQTMYVRPVRAF